MTTTINLDFGSKDFKIAGLESKFDFIGVPNSFVRCFEAELNRFETTVLYQLLRWHSWSNSGVVLRGLKWIYKSVAEMIEDAFRGIKPGKLYRALNKLVRLGFLQKEQLHREHYGGVHACAAYNRRYYYSPIMEKVIGCIVDTLTEESPQTLSTLGFSITENQISQNETTDFPKQKNITHTTSTSTLSPTPPLTPPGGNEESEPPIANSLDQPPRDTKEQVKPNLSPPCQNTIESQPVPFTDVVARPPRVEQKINQSKCTQDKSTKLKPVQVEVLPSESKPKANKVRKGTKPNNDFGLAPWKSLKQFKQFYRALVNKLPIVANSRSPEGLANKIIQQLKSGVPHSYWDDFVNGLPIGTSTQQEWEVEPGVPHPMFIEYLTEKLIKGNNSQTREQAIVQALNIASNPKQAIFFWKECKISLGNALSEAERHRKLGVQAVPTPLWTKQRPEPTLEEAAITGKKIQQIHSSTEALLEAAKNPQIEGSTGVDRCIPQSERNDPLQDDPWHSEVKPPKPKLSDFASEKVKTLLSKGSGKKSRDKSKKRYAQPDQWRRQPLRIEEMNFAEINKALTDPILRDELTPQLIFGSDYELITDELGRILRIEKPPE